MLGQKSVNFFVGKKFHSEIILPLKAIDNLDPEALDADKGIAFISPEKYF